MNGPQDKPDDVSVGLTNSGLVRMAMMVGQQRIVSDMTPLYARALASLLQTAADGSDDFPKPPQGGESQ